MFAMDFYLSACRCVMKADASDPESWADLYRLMPCLRRSLTCYVCFDLLYDPIGPTHNVCKHLICSKCVGGKMKLKPSCSWCKDQWDFKPNPLIKILVQCFKKLCVCVLNSPIGDAIQNSTQNGEKNEILRIINEVIEFNDDYVSNCNQALNPSQLKHEKMEIDTKIMAGPSEPCSSISDLKQNEQMHAVKHESEKKIKSSQILQNKMLNEESKLPEHEVGRGKRIKRTSRKLLLNKSITPPKKVLFTKKLKRKAIHISKQKRDKQYQEKQMISKLVNAEPMELEKIDNSVPHKKRQKQELSPPELKPLSFCKCGKSGNFNQLTCLGQRCACYSMKLPCIGCKCKGCRNPKKGPEHPGTTKSTLSLSVLRSGTRSLSDNVCVSY